MLNELELTGRARTHVVQRDDLRAAIHADALEPFLDMKTDAARDGLELALTSAFRDFTAQQRIWDMKFRGERPIYDEQGRERDRAALSEEEIVEAILCWNALPGASRHHWGTDIDVIDRAALPEAYRVRLTIDEYEPGGVFHALKEWLDVNAARYGFFRPYRIFRGGVRPEPWHLSYAPASVPALSAMSLELLADAVGASDILGKGIVLDRLSRLYERYVASVDAPDTPLTA
ncbi:MAG TPA: M15 family metallopeptidase [Burkholderiales bacterium]|nr:M15 family metallopeptidase [Burkholderiales bacterium]